MDDKYIYLLAINKSFFGFVYDEKDAIDFVKQRKKASYKRVKYNKRIRKIVEEKGEFLELSSTYTGILMRADEYDFFANSIDQYFLELVNGVNKLENIMGRLKFLKLSKKEKKYIKFLDEYCQWITSVLNYEIEYEYSELYDNVFDFQSMAQWFVNNNTIYPLDVG